MPGGPPLRLGALIGSTSTGTAVAFSDLDGLAEALDRVVLVPGFFVGSKPAVFDSALARARRVVRTTVRGFRGGFAGVTGPSDRSLRREGSDGRGSGGALRFGGIVS